ncbi:MAG: MFS transporter [Devosia sp.]|nr:MFS transporter [Devosia sp.]
MSPTVATPHKRNAPPIVPLVLAVALFMENMDSTVIATSLAAIAKDIHSDPIALKLALTSYLLALAIFIPITGWMADRFGARKIFQIALVIFVVGSIACAASNSLAAFIGARFFQGVGGAMMSPLARIVLVRATPRSELVSAMAWLTIPALIGPIVGPPLGGFLTTYFSWHWIFLINVPTGILGIWLTQKFLPEFERNAPRRMDFVGFLLVGGFFAGLVFGISVMSLPALPMAYGVATLIVGLALGIAYLFYLKRTPYPVLDLRLFRFPLFRTSVVGGSFFRLGVGATPFLLPLMLQLDFGLSPFQSGSLVFVGAFGALAAKFTARPLLIHFGFRLVLAVGAFAIGLFILAQGLFLSNTPYLWMLFVLVGAGFAQSTLFTSLNAFGVADISDRDAAQATAITTVIGQLCFALGVSLGGGALEISHALRGGELAHPDFVAAFFVVGLVGLLAVWPFARLPNDAGNAISGHGAEGPAGLELH